MQRTAPGSRRRAALWRTAGRYTRYSCSETPTPRSASVHAYPHTHTVHEHTCISTYSYGARAYMHIHILIRCTSIHAYPHTHTVQEHTCMSTYLYVCLQVHIHACTLTCMQAGPHSRANCGPYRQESRSGPGHAGGHAPVARRRQLPRVPLRCVGLSVYVCTSVRLSSSLYPPVIVLCVYTCARINVYKPCCKLVHVDILHTVYMYMRMFTRCTDTHIHTLIHARIATASAPASTQPLTTNMIVYVYHVRMYTYITRINVYGTRKHAAVHELCWRVASRDWRVRAQRLHGCRSMWRAGRYMSVFMCVCILCVYSVCLFYVFVMYVLCVCVCVCVFALFLCLCYVCMLHVSTFCAFYVCV
jgi:hypothetical protein